MVTKEDDRDTYGEQRLQNLGSVHGVIVFMVWVDRDDIAHLISVQKGSQA